MIILSEWLFGAIPCYRACYFLFRLLAWVESPQVSPLITRLGEYSYHLNQLVPSKLYVRPSGLHVSEKLEPGMKFK